MESQWPLKNRVKHGNDYTDYAGSYLRQRQLCIYQNPFFSWAYRQTTSPTVLTIRWGHRTEFWPMWEKWFAPLLAWPIKLSRDLPLSLFSHLTIDCQCPGDTGNSELKMVEPMSAWILEWLCRIAPHLPDRLLANNWFSKISEVITMTLRNTSSLKNKLSTFLCANKDIYVQKVYPIRQIVM